MTECVPERVRKQHYERRCELDIEALIVLL